jgi:hypothetical protein
MRQHIPHHLVGYDPTTDAVVFEQDIPMDLREKRKSWRPSDAKDPGYVYSYPLQGRLADEIMATQSQRGEAGRPYYIEGFARA